MIIEQHTAVAAAPPGQPGFTIFSKQLRQIVLGYVHICRKLRGITYIHSTCNTKHMQHTKTRFQEYNLFNKSHKINH